MEDVLHDPRAKLPCLPTIVPDDSYNAHYLLEWQRKTAVSFAWRNVAQLAKDPVHDRRNDALCGCYCMR